MPDESDPATRHTPMPSTWTDAHFTSPEIVGSTDPSAFAVGSRAGGPSRSLPLTDEMLPTGPRSTSSS
ncbi:MAG: hypothetical protein JO252_10845 [Planctomycetaceae bacterium]|nr:hypothetical protein [Planctomycetaceae bacterium]